MSVHAYQGNAEDVTPDAQYTKSETAKKSQSLMPGTGVKQGDAVPTRHTAEDQKPGAKNLWDVFLEHSVNPVTWFTGLLLLVGIAQWRALRRQVEKMTDAAKAAKDSVDAMQASTAVASGTLDHARETAQRELCAYVFTDGAQLWNFTPGVPSQSASAAEKTTVARHAKYGPVVVMKVKNFGRTPAYSFNAEIWMDIADPITPVLLKSSTEDLGRPRRRTIMPPDSHIFRIAVKENPHTDEQRASIRNGTVALYVYGEIGYQDTFGASVLTEFRFIYDATQHGTQKLVYADSGNVERREDAGGHRPA